MTPDLIQPDLVMVQCESFFDLRRSFPAARREILRHFDQLQAESALCGQLHVPAWGANTVRTEYAVLSGINPVLLKAHRYNPYRRLERHLVPTLAAYLGGMGYKTICVHPYAPTFYRRSAVMPIMGFDAFLALDAFRGASHFGPYISDQAVAQKIAALLDESQSQPLFIYAITMENHGPLHWEKVADTEALDYFDEHLPDTCRDLIAYARHVANADRMMNTLSMALNRRLRAASLCVFGDHVPIMPAVYAELGEPAGTTDFVCWNNAALRRHLNGACTPAPVLQDLYAHQLAPAFLAGAGLIPG